MESFQLFSVRSNQLTGSALMEGAVAGGRFYDKVDVKSQDELGVLSDSFNYMGDEIMKYMEEVKEKTRMEGELEVAHSFKIPFFQSRR